MWDCIAFLDQDTVNKVSRDLLQTTPRDPHHSDHDKINELGGLKFIVISHPHMYT